jgi:hypothetical protein
MIYWASLLLQSCCLHWFSEKINYNASKANGFSTPAKHPKPVYEYTYNIRTKSEAKSDDFNIFGDQKRDYKHCSYHIGAF